jgi:DNA invertase Pin-like site-specific DNA recombinase
LILCPGEDDPYQTALFQLLGVFAELEANMAQQRTKEGIAVRMNSDEEYHHGPAPLGFKKDDGELVESDNYDKVVKVLEMKQKGNIGTREAARELDCGTATVNRALNRGDLYPL